LQTGLYTFSIQVHDGNAQYTLVSDEPLYVKQTNAPAKSESVRVGSIDGEMFATWQTRMNAGYMVTLYDYETLAVIKTEYANGNFYSITLSDELDKVKISIAAMESNAYGEFDVFEIVRSTPSGTVAFPDYAATREGSIPIHIDCSADVTAGVYLDGALLLENASAGDYDLNLAEGVHEIVAYVKDAHGNMRTFAKSITVDRTPPVVNLNSADEVKTAFDSFVIEGSTEPNATVAINGVEQELGAGSFMAKLALANGVNPVSVSAYDLAGNKSVKTITVERSGSTGNGWTVYILPGIVFILLAVWYVYLNKKSKGVQPE
jgi:hypothetical protein